VLAGLLQHGDTIHHVVGVVEGERAGAAIAPVNVLVPEFPASGRARRVQGDGLVRDAAVIDGSTSERQGAKFSLIVNVVSAGVLVSPGK
jgi:hypothetical protein